MISDVISHRLSYAIALVIAVITLVLASGFAYAQSNSQNSGISRGFQTSEKDITTGALVSTKADGSSAVELATIDSADRLAGIVSTGALVELSENKQNEIQVILSGSTSALVSDINGPIHAGDKITASPVAGVGMLADTDAQIVGTAMNDFKPTDSQNKVIKDKKGKDHTIHIGFVSLQVGISYYVAPTSQLVPPFLQTLANSIAGRPVSLMRILLSCVLLVLAFGSIFVLIYTSVKSGIISLGRNPLAASAIKRGLFGAVGIVLLIAAAALIGTYIILAV